MAIKGKGRARSGRRAVARGPKPGYVEPPKPLFRRRWFRWTALAVLVAGVLAIVLSALLITASNNRKEAKAAAALKRQQQQAARVNRFALPVTQALQNVVVATAPGTVVRDFPDLPKSFRDLRSGALSDEDATAKGEEVTANATAAAKVLAGLNVSDMVRGFPQITGLIDARQYMLSSLQLYEQIGNGLGLAAGATGDEREALITQYLVLIPTASELFQNGYQKMVNAELASKVQPVQPPAPSPVPSASPSVSPTPSPAVSVTPPPSPTPSQKPSPKPSASKKASGGGGGGKASPKPSPSAS